VDFAPEQRASTQRNVCEAILTNKNITVLQHPHYSPDLAPCDFSLFPKIKSVLKGTHVGSVENVKAKTAEILKSLTQHDLRNCFEHWQHRMQLCVNSEGDYFEGDRS
jgi:transposase